MVCPSRNIDHLLPPTDRVITSEDNLLLVSVKSPTLSYCHDKCRFLYADRSSLPTRHSWENSFSLVLNGCLFSELTWHFACACWRSGKLWETAGGRKTGMKLWVVSYIIESVQNWKCTLLSLARRSAGQKGLIHPHTQDYYVLLV